MCDDYLDDLDAVSLYPSAMKLFDYPVGEAYWEHDVDKVVTALNYCDATFPLGIVECEITPDQNQICPLLSHRTKYGRLRYTLDPNQRLTKTTIDIMEAVKYNKARVTKVFNALLWKDRKPIFRDPITKLFTMRIQAKEEKNDALSQGTKLFVERNL